MFRGIPPSQSHLSRTEMCTVEDSRVRRVCIDERCCQSYGRRIYSIFPATRHGIIRLRAFLAMQTHSRRHVANYEQRTAENTQVYLYQLANHSQDKTYFTSEHVLTLLILIANFPETLSMVSKEAETKLHFDGRTKNKYGYTSSIPVPYT